MKTKEQKIAELYSNIELNYKLIDAIVDLQDAGFGSSALSLAQDEANMRVSINQECLKEHE
jgi:hypothetical protein